MALPASDGKPNRVIPLVAAFKHSEGAVKHGLAREALFRESFISPESDPRISFAQLGLLYANIMVETDDHFVGLARRPAPSAQLALMLRVMIACATVERALNALVQFHGLGHPIRVALHTDRLQASLCVYCDDEAIGPNAPVIEDSYIQSIFGGLSYFLGRRFPAIFVVTRNRNHPLLGVRAYGIDAPFRLGQVAAIHFPAAVMAEARQGNPTDDIFWTVVEHWLAILNGSSARRHAERVAPERLNTTALCEDLGISPATFRRRNSQAGASFRRFREETLVEASFALLADDRRSIASIASELGYADVRSYRRFIKGATGLTPDQLRAECRAAAMEDLQPKVAAAIKDIAVRLSQ